MASSGPSRLQGNLLGRFRGGLGLERGPAYPTRGNTLKSELLFSKFNAPTSFIVSFAFAYMC